MTASDGATERRSDGGSAEAERPSSRIDAIFAAHRARGRAVLMPFITAGYPSLEVTASAIPALESAGAGIVELGIPFSDPIADGPVIASSMSAALERGVRPTDVLDVVRRVRPDTGLGILVMTSASIVMRIGPEAFIDEAAEAGVDGFIIPDLDTGAAGPLRALAVERGLSFSLLVSPTTPEPRIKEITRQCAGFVYVLARIGLTGEQASAPRIESTAARIRRHTSLPLAVGFGITTADHVAAVAEAADAAIVGSALVRRMGDAGDPVAAAREYVKELARGLG